MCVTNGFGSNLSMQSIFELIVKGKGKSVFRDKGYLFTN